MSPMLPGETNMREREKHKLKYHFDITFSEKILKRNFHTHKKLKG